MTTLQFTDASGNQEIKASSFVLNGKALFAIDERGGKSCVAVWRGTTWLLSNGRRSQMRFVGDTVRVHLEDESNRYELTRGQKLRLTGSRGHQPRLGDVVELEQGLWRMCDKSRKVARLVISSAPSFRLAA